MGKRPAILLYDGDWIKDSVSGCSLASQGLWLRMMFIGHNSERYGYLCQNGVAIPSESIARRCGCTPEQYTALLAELDDAGVPSRTPEGIIFSRRMVRDEVQRRAGNERVKKCRSNTSVTRMKQASSSSVSSTSTKPKPKPSATSRGVLPQDSRHRRIQAMVMNCYQEQTGAECPWDGGEGKQLQSLLTSTPNWADTQIAQCLGNMYASTGFAKGSRPREWLTKLPKYLHGPLNEFNRENTPYVSKAQQRQDASHDAIRTALARITGEDGGLVESSLSLPGNDARDSGIVLEGDGKPGLRSRKASAGGGS